MDGTVNLAEKLARFSEHWAPRTVATFNGHDVMVVKAKGEFVWHKHDDTDDLFLVLRGRLVIQLRDGVAGPVRDPDRLAIHPATPPSGRSPCLLPSA